MAKKTFEIEINGLDKIVKESNQTVTTMNQLKKTLKELKKEAGDLDVASDEFAQISQKINNITKQLKALEKQQGTTSRNVGNYADEIKEAFKDINKDVKEVAENIKKVNDTPFEIQIDDVTYKFENLSQALGEIDDKAQGLSAQMMALKDAGQANTQEYANLQAQFEKYVGKAAELEKARKFSDEIKDSLSQQNRTLTLAVDGFQALGNALQIASGFAGLFGKNQNEIEKSINRTVQIMAILQSSQELYNLYLKNSTILIKAWNIALLATDKVMKAVGVSTTGTSTAMKGLRAAIASTGIGALVVALGMAVSKLFDWVEGLVNAKSPTDAYTDSIKQMADAFSDYRDELDKISQLKIDLGLSTQTKEATKAYQRFLKDFEQIKKSVTRGDTKLSLPFERILNVDLNDQKATLQTLEDASSYVILIDDTLEKIKDKNDEETAQLRQRLTFEKEIYDIVLGIFQARLKMNNAFKADNNEYIKEQEEEQRKNKEYNDKLKEAEDELIDYNIQSMEDGLEKQKAILYEEQRQQLNAVRERGVKVQELEAAIKAETNRKLLALEEEYARKKEEYRERLNKEIYDKEVENETALLRRDTEAKTAIFSEMIGSYANEMYRLENTSNDITNKILTNFDKLNDINDIFKISNKNDALYGNGADMANIRELERQYALQASKFAGNQRTKEYEDFLFNNDVLQQFITKYKDTGAGILGEIYLNNLKEAKINFEKTKKELTKEYEDAINALDENDENYLEDVNKLTNVFQGALLIAQEKYYDDLIKIDNETYQKRSEIQKAYYDKQINVIKTGLDNAKKIEEKYSSPIMTGNMFADALGTLSQDIFKKNNFSGVYKDIIAEISKEKEMLDEDLRSGIISDEVYIATSQNLDKILTETQTSLASLEGDWRSWTQKVTSVIGAFSSQIFDLFSQGFQVSFDNQQRELEKQQDLLDAETEAIEKALSKQEEIYQAHADKVISIEDELANARGERRQFLIEQLAEETKKQQEAYAAQQKLEKQKEQQEAKAKALQAQQEILEKQRNITNQKIQIAQALANTALGVTSALTVQPFFLGLALASLVGAMGAAQVGIIAAQKFADGGIIQGPSHEKSGVKVLGGTAEVEGGEYIVNRQTTSNNVDLLNYINSQKRSLTAADLNYYFNQKQSTYAMPTSSIQSLNSPSMMSAKSLNQVILNDNRPIVVSVEEIERVSNNVRNVKALAGL